MHFIREKEIKNHASRIDYETISKIMGHNFMGHNIWDILLWDIILVKWSAYQRMCI